MQEQNPETVKESHDQLDQGTPNQLKKWQCPKHNPLRQRQITSNVDAFSFNETHGSESTYAGPS